MNKEAKIIFTDLDNTLLDKNYSFEKAKEGLKKIKSKNIPLIICTSKTRAEIEFYRKKLKNKHPFISENGGAIFIPKKYFKQKFKYTKKIKDYYVIELGQSYERLIKNIKNIKSKTKTKIISFNELSIDDLMNDSGLNKKQAKLSKKREYDEPFKLLGSKKQKKETLSLIKKSGLNYTKGGRYYHILGNNNKGKAVKILKRIYEKETNKKIKTISLGDSLNDFQMLKATDKAFLMQKPDKTFAKIKNIKHIQGIGPQGWNNTIQDLLWEFNKEKAEQIYQESLKIIKKLQLKNGAILASYPKGRYPYIYPRDHAICTLALIDSGFFTKAKKALEFSMEIQNSNGSYPQRASKEGKDRSYKPIQLDNTALILYAFALYVKSTNDKKFLKRYNKKIKKSVDYIQSQLNRKYLFFTPNSIHEFPPYEEGLEIWANATCYAALKELEEIGIKNKINLKKLKTSIIKHFWNGEYFIKNIRLKESSSIAKEIDPSAYSLAEFGILKDHNEKIEKTVKEIEKKLWHKKLGGICRYEKHIGRNNGGYGPWPHFTLMICRHFIRIGNRKKAEEYLTWILKIAENNKLPEHIATKKDFEKWVKDYRKAGILRKDREIMIDNIRKTEHYKKGIAYSVLPLAWPHAEFIRTWLLFKEKFVR